MSDFVIVLVVLRVLTCLLRLFFTIKICDRLIIGVHIKGAKVPGNESSMERIGLGATGPGAR